MTLNAIKPGLVPRRCKGNGAVLPWVKPGVQALLAYGTKRKRQYEVVTVIRVSQGQITVRKWCGTPTRGEYHELTVGMDRVWPTKPHAPSRAR